MRRRRFLESVVALAAAPGASRVLAAVAGSDPGLGIHGILVYDARFARARQFAMAWPATRRFDVGPDAGRLWSAHLEGQAQAGVELAGLTTGADARMLQDLARIHRFRLRRWQRQPDICGGVAGSTVLIGWIIGNI